MVRYAIEIGNPDPILWIPITWLGWPYALTLEESACNKSAEAIRYRQNRHERQCNGC